MKVSYRMAGIKFTFEGDINYTEKEFDTLFHANDDEPDDYHFQYIEVDKIDTGAEDAEFLFSNYSFDVYRYKGLEYRCFKHGSDEENKYGAVLVLEGREGRYYYHKNHKQKSAGYDSLYIFNNQMIERVFLNENAVILHSSYIVYRGKAILFSAPSTTGKSTQAELWEKYAGAEIINGDRSIMKKENGRWMVYGLPMCGSSNICKNVSVPLDSVVLLAKLPENVLAPAKPREALTRLYRECTINSWNEDCVNKLMDMLTDLISSVNVYTYGCTKEKEAVDVLRQAIDAKMDKE